MIQISDEVFCDDFLATCEIENRLLPNPYYPYPYLIIENFFNPQEMATITHAIQEQQDEVQAQIKSTLLNSVVVPSIDKEIRKTSLSKLPECLEEYYRERFLEHQPMIENFYAMGLTNGTPPQVLSYYAGDFYIKHADDSSELVDKEGNTVGFNCVAPERKITTVLFGTSHISHDGEGFEGGELLFNYLYDSEGNQVTLCPKAGDMLVFLSNPFFSHEVKVVKSGYRLTIVQWHNAL
ncbi:MAG: 2OG-Fe(II) oxygenase [Campylobacterales bacterium]|nr:2OG-Fe(II) oxygenase [Campylobacterales bacterium]